MKRKLAPKIIEYLKAPGPKRLDVWDTILQGFGVRVLTERTAFPNRQAHFALR